MAAELAVATPIGLRSDPHLEINTDGESPVQVITDNDWQNNPKNARNWSATRKILTTALVSSIGFTCAMGSSIYSASRPLYADTLHLSSTVSVLPLVFYNLGMGLGPLLASPLSETLGRRKVYLLVCPLFCLFVLGTGLADTIASLCILRFFAGTFASPSVAIAAATIADMYAPRDRAVGLLIYYSTPWIGALFGPLIGSLVIDQGRRWFAWTTLLFAAATMPGILLSHESYAPTIRTRLNPDTNRQQLTLRVRLGLFVRNQLKRPLKMLATEPIVAGCCTYMSFQFGLLYTLVTASPSIYAETYAFGPRAQGLSFLGLILGSAIGTAVLIGIEKWIYQPRLRRNPDLAPENRLVSSMMGSILLPTGLFIFAWTARNDISFYVPVVAQAVVGMGSLLVYCGAGMYMMDVYGAEYGASASGANSLLRYALAASFPLFALRLFETLGTGWGTTLLGALTIGMAPIPWVFSRYGRVLRRRSGFKVAVD